MDSAVSTAKELFAAGKYAECKAHAEQAMTAGNGGDADAAAIKELKLLVRKCNTHLVADAPSTTAPAIPADAAPAPTTTVPFAGNVRFEWFQTPSTVTFTFYVKSRLASDVKIVSTERSFDIVILLDPTNGREYQYTVERLFAPVAAEPTINIRPMKVEITLNKRTSFHWPSLEVKHDDDVVRTIEQPQAVAAATAPSTAKELVYPNSKGKDWAHFKVDEEEEKPEGDAALNALFKQIYGNGTDEQRRAMMKSFSESNGTVLSTNWDEVGKKKVVGEPPRGMEAKPYVD